MCDIWFTLFCSVKIFSLHVLSFVIPMTILCVLCCSLLYRQRGEGHSPMLFLGLPLTLQIHSKSHLIYALSRIGDGDRFTTIKTWTNTRAI